MQFYLKCNSLSFDRRLGLKTVSASVFDHCDGGVRSTHGARTTSSGVSRAKVVIGPMVISDRACGRSPGALITRLMRCSARYRGRRGRPWPAFRSPAAQIRPLHASATSGEGGGGVKTQVQPKFLEQTSTWAVFGHARCSFDANRPPS